MPYDQVQFAPVFQTPVIVDDFFDSATFVGEHFQSMPIYGKGFGDDMLEFHPSPAMHGQAGFAPYLPSTYTQQVYQQDLQSTPGSQSYEYYHDNDYVSVTPGTPEKFTPIDFTPRQPPQMNGFPIDQQSISRKRKTSDDSEQSVPHVAKKVNLTHVKIQENPSDYYDFSGHTSPYSPYIATPAATAPLPVSMPRGVSPRAIGHHHSTSIASQASVIAPSPHTPAWSPSFTTVKSEHSPRLPMTPLARPASASASLKSSVPKLVRTSTIQQSPMGLTANVMTPNKVANFNPYAMYPLKANLKLKGDLDGMVKDWSSDEIDARRRLIEFKRSQVGSTITADFKPVTPQERGPSSITISCILWKEKKEYFVTSVDTIYLLEALVGVRFTVEEKNRIRRNLEGFRPMTVSKSKLDSEDFFKTIMGFPHPKPRNIEKDVKVFPWKILSHALKKIISKYSASYSSTASSLMTPINPNYSTVDLAAEYHYMPSPPVEMPRNVPAQYSISTPLAYPSGPVSGRMSAPVTTAPVQEFRLQMPTAGPSYHYNAYEQPQYQPTAQPALPMGAQMMSAQMPPAWEYAEFERQPIMTPHSAPPTTTTFNGYEAAEFYLPVQYSAN